MPTMNNEDPAGPVDQLVRPLVERLRGGVYGLARIELCSEAADEIERLTAENRLLQNRHKFDTAEYARLTDLNSGLTDKANQYLIENARLDRELAAETARWEEAVRLTWQMVDPLKPAGEPGSYWRGQDAGIVAALTTLRANLKRHNVRANRPARGPQE